MRSLAAWAVLGFSLSANGQSWDFSRCERYLTQAKAYAGHACTPEHLATDLATLKERTPSPPDAVALVWAETGLLEDGAAATSTTLADSGTTVESTVRWALGSPHSKEFLVEGSRARVIDMGSLSVMALVESSDGPLRVAVYVANKGEQPFDVIPDKFTLAVVEPKEKAKPLPYMSPKEIAKKIANDAAWLMVAEAIASAGRAMQKATTTTSGTVTTQNAYGKTTSYGTYNGIATTYDNTANQQQTAANVAAIADASEARKVRETTGALLPNTVFPGQNYGGVAHFKREKKAALLLLRAPIAGQVFEFPLEIPPK